MYFKIFALIAILISNAALSSEEYQWVQYVHENHLVARATTLKDTCPMITVNEQEFRMNFRTDYEDIKLKEKIRICEYDVTQAKSVLINNKALKLPPKQIKRFIIIGDTGCESSVFDKKYTYQNCEDKNSWPFETIANRIIDSNPDFVIHMGDYGYRNKYKTEEDAVKNQKMQWFFFKEDFFKPAEKLLSKAPMIFVRGNHESCSLTGKAWFMFLDAQSYKQDCLEQSPTYNLNIDGLNLVVFDSSSAVSGLDFSKKQLEQYKSQFSDIVKELKEPSWLLIHQPILSLSQLSAGEKFPSKLAAPVINQAFGESFTKKIPLSISGHFHLMAYVVRKSDKFEQFIFGNSGSSIHKANYVSYSYEQRNEKGEIKVKYGYTQFDRINYNKWKATVYDINGKELFSKEVSKLN